MTKHNRKRYMVKQKPRRKITFSGNIYLRYVDEEDIAQAKKGDFLLFPQNDALNGIKLGEYDQTGNAGYFRVDVHDGREWKPVILTDLFDNREHYFRKSERPIDTYELCRNLLLEGGPIYLQSTYREHYETTDAPEGAPAEEE